jgi:hypothetical protein
MDSLLDKKTTTLIIKNLTGKAMNLFILFLFILFAQITLIYIQINHKIETIYIGLGTL